jgi:hypothetical protein
MWATLAEVNPRSARILPIDEEDAPMTKQVSASTPETSVSFLIRRR